MNWHSRFFWRELRAGAYQLALFVVCVFLASLSLSVVSGWRHSVDDAMAEETRKGAGGDVVAFSTEPFSEGILEGAKAYDPILTTEMFTVSLALRTDRTLFSKLKAVEQGYPYYGDVPLLSGRNIHQALKEGLVVEARVLERLEIEVGDDLKIGDRVFTIADVALSEPDRPLGMWGVSPRIFVAYDDLDSTGLLRPDSYLERRIHIKLEDRSQASEVAEALRQVAVPDQERVETWERPPVNMERYVENFFTFLDMMAVLAVALGGLGMRSTLSAWLRSRTQTVAVARTLGANQRFVLVHYTGIVLAAALIGFLLGLGAAGYTLISSGEYLSQMLPVQVVPRLSISASLESAFLCLVVSLAFASWPLYQTGQIRPAAVLRQEELAPGLAVKIVFATSLVLGLFALLSFLVSDLSKAFWITLSLSVVAAISGAVSYLIVRLLKRLKPRSLVMRTALGSWRSPEAKTELVVFILSTCLAVLYTAVICQQALRQSWIDAMPPLSPNLILLDIQPHQMESFSKDAKYPLDMYENLRVRVTEINGEPLDRSGKREYWQRDGRGKMDALPTLELPPNDELLQGDSLYADTQDAVSIRRDMAEALQVGMGDELTFSIQGVPLKATITSVRRSHRKGFKPRFELLFPPTSLEGAPRTVFAITRVPEDDIGPLQTRLAKLYPGVVSMDLSVTIKLIAERLAQMLGLVAYFLWSGIAAGVLILISATWSARQRRARESAYYKVMGAGTGFLNRVIWAENLVLGLLTAALGLGLALIASAVICYWKLDVPFPSMPQELLWMLFLPGLTVAVLGWLVSRKVVEARPAPYLREG
jgi:putative ABC transport system permease protein